MARQLVVYSRRGRLRDLAVLALLSAVAGFVRSEGWALGPLALLGVAALRGARDKSPGRDGAGAGSGQGRLKWRRLAACVAVYTAALLLRCSLVSAQTGLFLPDIRAMGLMGGENVAKYYGPLNQSDAGPLAREIARGIRLAADEANKGDTPWKRFDHQTSIVEIVLLTLLVMGIVWRGGLGYAGRYEAALAVSVCGMLMIYAAVAVAMSVDFQSRQLANVVSLLSPWAAIGLTQVGRAMDMLRSWRRSWWNRWAGAWRWRLVAIVVLLLMAVPGTVASFQREGLKMLGQDVLAARGPGQRILETSGQASFYAKAEFLSLPVYPVQPYVAAIRGDELLTICRESRADFLVVDQNVDLWCPDLMGRLKDADFAREVTTSERAHGSKQIRLVDVRRLLNAWKS